MAGSTPSPGSSTAVSLRLPFEPSSVGVARHQLQSWMARHGSSADATDDARLVLSELVGNAVRHAQPLEGDTLEVFWEHADQRPGRPGPVRIAVTDGGSRSLPHRVDAGLADIAGRGLSIVEALAARWWREGGASRQTVHAVLPIG